ncbi:hypothetical protein HMPREF0758_0850 [Serratia odorifera DSM 4582]|uniref:Uncharacterized protein n=1 Tax=Serratia odorifera DSM 4582 TaxID=667129 RepID=D4DY67_SEROD|nr:hypothetical protein HMPREF0758_0850 [Serratia odorifera DSM 4582]
MTTFKKNERYGVGDDDFVEGFSKLVDPYPYIRPIANRALLPSSANNCE